MAVLTPIPTPTLPPPPPPLPCYSSLALKLLVLLNLSHCIPEAAKAAMRRGAIQSGTGHSRTGEEISYNQKDFFFLLLLFK